MPDLPENYVLLSMKARITDDSVLREAVKNAPSTFVEPSQFVCQPNAGVRFVIDDDLPAAIWAAKVLEPRSGGPRIVAATDGSAPRKTFSEGVGLVIHLLDGDNADWNTDGGIQSSFALKEDLDSAPVESIGVFCGLLQVADLVRDWKDDPINQVSQSDSPEKGCSPPSVVICTDSQQSIRFFEALYYGQTTKGLGAVPSKYRDHMLQALERLISFGCSVEIRWTPAHVGVPINETVDRLARLGVVFASQIPRSPQHPTTWTLFWLTDLWAKNVLLPLGPTKDNPTPSMAIAGRSVAEPEQLIYRIYAYTPSKRRDLGVCCFPLQTDLSCLD